MDANNLKKQILRSEESISETELLQAYMLAFDKKMSSTLLQEFEEFASTQPKPWNRKQVLNYLNEMVYRKSVKV